MDTIKVGLIGTGYIGMVHLEMLRRLGGIDVVAVADTNAALVRRAAAKFGIARVHESAAALLADLEVDVVHNCAPNNVHFDINAAAIEAGKEVLSEKPLALDSRESGELLALAEKRGTLTAINFCYRYYPVVQEAAARARRGVDPQEPTVKINLEKIVIPPQVKKALENEFENTLKLLQSNSQAYVLFKRWYVDGRLYYHAIIDKAKPGLGIQELRYVDPRKIKKIRHVKKIQTADPTAAQAVQVTKEYYMYNEQGFAPQ